MFNNTINQFTRKIIAIILSAAVMLLLLGTTANPARAAATIMVNSTDDNSITAGDAKCTLREAINNVNAASDTTSGDCAAGTGSNDTIKFSVSGTIKMYGQKTININLTIDGTGQSITLDAQGLDRVFCVPGNTALTTNALTITNGTPSTTICGSDNGGGGAIDSGGAVTVTNSTFTGNSAPGGQGGAINSAGALTVTNSTLSGNSAAAGGGLYSAGAVTVTNSTFSSNSAVAGGGGLFSVDAVTVTNSTFSGNSAGFSGGLESLSAVTVTNSTFSGNSTRTGGILSSIAVTVTNTIITQSTGGACDADAITSTNNLIDDGTCGTTLGTVTGLSTTLANNGGPTQTLALSAGSNAIDGVPAGQCTVATDQRGYGRPAGLLCDIGAYEYGAVAPSPAIVSSNGAVTNGPVLSSCYQPNGSLVSSVKINVPTVTANGAAATIFCQILTDPAQYNVINQPVTLAIDVFALTAGGQSVTAFNTPVQVCLQGSGSLLFRDATGSPRVTTSINAISNGGYTCGNIPNAGTLILVAGTAAPAGNVGSAAVASHPLTDCRVTTLYGLKLHSAPDVNSGAVGAGVAANVTLTATDRAGDWVKVTYGADTGWLLIPNDLSLGINNCN